MKEAPCADHGIDGEIVRYAGAEHPWRAVVSVKGGGVNVTQIRDLRGTMERERADGGIFVSLRKPTGPMFQEAIRAGLTDDGFTRIQILTADDLIHGKLPKMPPLTGVAPLAPVLQPERPEVVPMHGKLAAGA